MKMKRSLFAFLFTLVAVSFLLRGGYRTLAPFGSHYPEANGEAKPTPSITPRKTPQKPRLKDSKDTLRLASWNIRFFNNKRTDMDISWICDILDDFDIIAMQEVLELEPVKRCVAEMKKRKLDFSYSASKKVGSRRYKEYYVFFYRKDKISQIGCGITYDDRKSEFIREPYYATFKCGKFDFTLITIHILMKSPRAPEREKELTALARVFTEVQNQSKKENDIVLLGDFNEPPTSKWFHALNDIPTILFRIMGKNTLIKNNNSLLLDNIIYQEKYTKREFNGKWGVLNFDEEMFGDNDKAARLHCSDHRPVWALFRTNLKDDD